MKKSTKGALAAAAAGTLLLGGASTLAFWADDASVAGSTITAGTLDLNQTACGDWVLDGTGGTGGPLAGRLLVPGDSLTKQCTYTISSTGDHLAAKLDVSVPTSSGDLKSALSTNSSSFTITKAGGSPQTVTPGSSFNFDEGDYTVVADFAVTFPYGSSVDNSSQGDSATFDAISLTVTQVNNH
ncbi:alternate signal-mediated exported protein [Marmoricola sp. OAE513]|uniref:alternate-type signal peptide domain-containing protein n=1 Tax=Marmoricola sp. OAE513 TaxID=2817894 RepID=UPI001AE7643D